MEKGLNDDEVLELDKLIDWLQLNPSQKFRVLFLLKKWNGEQINSKPQSSGKSQGVSTVHASEIKDWGKFKTKESDNNDYKKDFKLIKKCMEFKGLSCDNTNCKSMCPLNPS